MSRAAQDRWQIQMRATGLQASFRADRAAAHKLNWVVQLNEVLYNIGSLDIYSYG